MAATEGFPGECHIDRLSNELLSVILRRAAPEKYLKGTGCHLTDMKGKELWVSARALCKLKTVCKRFREHAVATHVAWDLSKKDTLTAVKALIWADLDTRGLALQYKGSLGFRIESRQPASASLEFLAGMLTKTPNLRSFVLSCSEKVQSKAACQILWELLARLPLECLWLLDSGFMLDIPLPRAFNGLLDVRLHGSSITDAFLHSLLEQAPNLEVLDLENCNGLEQPEIKAPRLLELTLYYTGIASNMLTIRAPNLEKLVGLPPLRSLNLEAAAHIKMVQTTGPIGSVQRSVENIEVSKLIITGADWRLEQVVTFLSAFGASKSFDINIENWSGQSQREPFSNFLSRLPRTLEYLGLGTATKQLFESNHCSERLEEVKFERLTEVQLEVLEPKDFDLLHLALRCCPKVETATVALKQLEKPVDGLISRTQDLQNTEFPQVEFDYEEPPQFVSSWHLDDVANSPNRLQGLVDEVRGFEP